MKIISKESLVGRNRCRVELEDDESTLPDPVLVSMADGLERKDATYRFENAKHPGHFGGSVTRDARSAGEPLGKKTATIVVFID